MKNQFDELHKATNAKEKQEFKGYEVVRNGEVLFSDLNRAICNSFICKNGIQGVKPTLAP